MAMGDGDDGYGNGGVVCDAGDVERVRKCAHAASGGFSGIFQLVFFRTILWQLRGNTA